MTLTETMHGYEQVMDAIHVVQKHLRKDWMDEGCKDERVLGCASCTMTRLHEDLNMLMYEIENTILDAKPVA